MAAAVREASRIDAAMILFLITRIRFWRNHCGTNCKISHNISFCTSCVTQAAVAAAETAVLKKRKKKRSRKKKWKSAAVVVTCLEEVTVMAAIIRPAIRHCQTSFFKLL